MSKAEPDMLCGRKSMWESALPEISVEHSKRVKVSDQEVRHELEIKTPITTACESPYIDSTYFDKESIFGQDLSMSDKFDLGPSILN